MQIVFISFNLEIMIQVSNQKMKLMDQEDVQFQDLCDGQFLCVSMSGYGP